MLEAASEARGFIAGRTRQDLDTDRLLALALVQLVEIIGEAASRVSPTTQHDQPRIPWPQIIGMRNRLVHRYFEIDLDRVWDTVSDDLPPLIAELEKILPTELSTS